MMRRLLIVSPNFPPSNAPDLQRVRTSLPHFPSFGWEPIVLAVDPAATHWPREPLLLRTVPAKVPVYRVGALPLALARSFGVSNAALRALPFLYSTGRRILRAGGVDLVYFSTTAFPTMALGRLWKREFGVPFVLDFQDPWASDRRGGRGALKARLAGRIHRALESFTMRAADGIVAVSSAYADDLCRRYPWVAPARCRTVPFGASETDFEIAAETGAAAEVPTGSGGAILRGVYAGVLGPAWQRSCVALCEALHLGLERHPDLFRRVRLGFFGSDYAGRRKRIEPIARSFGLEDYVTEEPEWLPYFDVLRLLRAADLLIVPGNDDPRYTASKIYPYILARRPLLALFHEASSVVDVLRSTGAGEVVTFGENPSDPEVVSRLEEAWAALLGRIPFVPETDWRKFERYTARALTREQCELFAEIAPGRSNGSFEAFQYPPPWAPE